MKKIALLLLIFPLFCTMSFNQNTAENREQKVFIYSEITGLSRMPGTKRIKVSVDFGQDTKALVTKNKWLIDDKGENMTFGSMVDAMNLHG